MRLRKKVTVINIQDVFFAQHVVYIHIYTNVNWLKAILTAHYLSRGGLNASGAFLYVIDKILGWGNDDRWVSTV